MGDKPEEAAVAKVTEVVPEVKFDWEQAERVELKGQFIMQADFVFLNIAFKGYNKDSDVRYALSEDEFWMEVRDRSCKGVG